MHKVPFPALQQSLNLQSVAQLCEVPDVTTCANAALSGIGITAIMAAKQLRALCTMDAQLSDSGMSWQIMLSSSFPHCPLIAEL